MTEDTVGRMPSGKKTASSTTIDTSYCSDSSATTSTLSSDDLKVSSSSAGQEQNPDLVGIGAQHEGQMAKFTAGKHNLDVDTNDVGKG